MDTFLKLGGAGIISGLALWLVRTVYSNWQSGKKDRAKDEAKRKDEMQGLLGSIDGLKDAVVGLEHHDLYQTCQEYLDRGSVSTAELNDLDYLYKPYKALGGNGTGELLYNKVQQLRIRKEDTNE